MLWLQHKVETKEVHVSAVGIADNIADLGTKRLNCNTTRYLMHLCGVFNGSELVGKAEYDEMQRKRLLSRMSQNQQLLNVNYRILQLALLMNMPDNALSLEPGMADGEPGIIQLLYIRLSYISAELYMQSIYIPAELYMQLCYFLGKVYENFLGFVGVLLLVLGLMVWYYRMLWKNAVVDSDKLFEISENLASQQHRRALEGLQEFRAFTRRRRRRLAFGRLDIDEPHGEPGVEVDAAEPLPVNAEPIPVDVEPAEVGVQTEEAEAEDDSSDSGSRRERRYLHCGLSEASDPDLWMQVRHHNLRGEDDRFVHSDDLELITSACTKYDMDAEQFCELLEGYGGDHLKRQMMTALGTVMYYHEQGRDEDANRLMCDVQYTRWVDPLFCTYTFDTIFRMLNEKTFDYTMRN